MSIPVSYLYSLCEIKTMENQLISKGTISEINSDSIKVADKDEHMELISFGIQVKINIFNSKNGFRVVIGKVLSSNEREVKITDLISLVEHERRQFFRVDLRDTTNAYIANTLIEAQVTEPIYVVVNDLSLTGLRLETKTELEIGSTIWIEFKIKNRTYFWQCIVVRMVEYDELGVYHYGCQFVFENSKENDTLCSYIFQLQREQFNRRDTYCL